MVKSESGIMGAAARAASAGTSLTVFFTARRPIRKATAIENQKSPQPMAIAMTSLRSGEAGTKSRRRQGWRVDLIALSIVTPY
ncbi:MAG: hypothetical protein K0S78_5374 [Thermomicrobiales bacterium]|nr:hypothetical protein [Thermomicrobiales bacterium]